MRSVLFKKIKQNSAFTMMEMLVAVAVLVVLLGISMIGISHLVSDLKMTELDRYAKTIYLEAQNQLTAKEVEGGMGAYYDRFAENYENRFLQIMPQDYNTDDNNDGWKQLCYITKDDEITETLIATTTNIYQTQGDYIIELNPQSGDIYGVFYWDKEEAISYTDITNLVDRSKEERTELQIGYYGGAISDTMSSGVELDQRVQLVNAEELSLKVSYDASARLRRYYASSLKIEYFISNEAGTALWSGELDLNSMVDTGERLEFYLLLDSLKEGSEFKKITAGSGLIPGENLSIVVKSTYEHGADFCVESNETEPVVGNSLFGNRTDRDTIEIANLRHFRNLDENYVAKALYTRTNGEALNVEITENIDFADNGYISEIAPISNDAILSNATVTGLVNAEMHVLKHFVVNGTKDNVGIFASTNNVIFENITIQDITVTADGCTNVGALVGSMSGGRLENCGVYLTTSLEENGTITYYSQQADATGMYKNEMERRYHTFKIIGQEKVGGLIGACSDTVIENCYAAVQVEAAGNTAGGFAGEVSAGKIENTYASGDVTAVSFAGGFIGAGLNATVTQAYSTGNVYGEGSFGGFVGKSITSLYQSCTSYGEVLKKGMSLLDNAAAGGFVYAESSSNNTYSNCKYMTQSGFNKIGLSDPAIIGTSGYKAFVAAAGENILSVGGSFPYKNTLFQMAFPFEKLPNQTQHYGNWPAQYVIDTSMVYYEKYADGAYGYYGVTYITDDSNIWLLDTLREETCVEDGYGLLTKYNLDSFVYDLYVGSGATATASDVSLEIINAESIQNGTDAAGKMVRLIQQGNIEFTAYTSYDTVTGNIAGKTGESFLANGMYLYQLPYDLQCTDRYGIDNFYDRFVIKNVRAKGSNTIVIENMTFFYCPHFAKTAVNPNVNSAEEAPSSIWNPQYISVRSARQLNALGRYPYYWNARGGNDAEMFFIQESDINFSSYTNGTKLYCGQEFDLLDFSKEYANKPIGQTYREDLTASEGYGADYSYAQFSNNYNGKSYQIIDYCVESNLMFVGLFGEIMDATIENVVMTISEEAARADYTGNAGKIISTHVAVGDSTGRTGIGGLVGMSYLENNSITNCAIAGYDVELHLGADHIGRLAVGGLAGFSMSSISNCAATNDVKIVLLTDGSGNNASAFLAGLAGSFLYGTLENCYSGGTIDIVDGDGNGYYKIGHVTVGGITAGGLYTPNNYTGYSEKEEAANNTSWSNLYTYTQILTDKRDSDGTNITKLFSAHTRYYRDPNGIGSWLTQYDETAIGVDGVNCYYLDTAYDGLTITVRDRVGPGYRNLDKSVSLDYAGLSGLAEGTLTNRVASKDTTYPTSTLLANARYPFPAVVKNVRTDEYVHYGDWPVDEQRAIASYPLYFEQYGENDYGVYYIEENGAAVSTLVTDDSKDILRTGYGYMTLDASQSVNALFSYEIETETEVLTYYALELGYEELYAAAGTTSAVSGNARQILIPYTYETVIVSGDEILSTESATQKNLYVNPNFAAALSLNSDDLGTAGKPLQVRTPEQFASVGLVAGSDIYMCQTHSLDLSAGHTPIIVSYSHVYDGGADTAFAIRNATNTIFETNNGTITNTKVVDSVIDTQSNAAVFVNTNTGKITDATVENAQLTTTAAGAGFVYTNGGTIQNASVVSTTAYTDTKISAYRAFGFVVENTGTISKSCAVGTVTGLSEAAGFAAQNTGAIQTSYANTRVSGTAAMVQAAGFVLRNTNLVDSLKFCYAAGSVEGYTTYGFMESGKASWCYTISQLNGANRFGFAGDNAETDACYWGYDVKSGYNATVNDSNGKGLPIALSRLMRGYAGDDYDGDVNPDLPFNEDLGTEYPYPSVGLVHIGDWQPPSVEQQNTTVETWTLNDRWKEAGIFYYERYLDGSYGVYLVGANTRNQSNSEVLVNTLAAADEPILTSGYGVFYQDARWEIDIRGDWENGNPVTDYEGNVLDGFTIEGVEDDYKFRYITQQEAEAYFICTLTYNGQTEKNMMINSGNFDRPE
ncbi:MAG: hypothetical protein IJ455_07825 [Agathobacter sp.]|nr:hypothetical protein [Agathobacter sp.]